MQINEETLDLVDILRQPLNDALEEAQPFLDQDYLTLEEEQEVAETRIRDIYLEPFYKQD